MRIVKVTAENKMSWLTPGLGLQAFRVGDFLLIDDEGRVREAGLKRECIAKAWKIWDDVEQVASL